MTNYYDFYDSISDIILHDQVDGAYYSIFGEASNSLNEKDMINENSNDYTDVIQLNGEKIRVFYSSVTFLGNHYEENLISENSGLVETFANLIVDFTDETFLGNGPSFREALALYIPGVVIDVVP
jgi:hypothetical protein